MESAASNSSPTTLGSTTEDFIAFGPPTDSSDSETSEVDPDSEMAGTDPVDKEYEMEEYKLRNALITTLGGKPHLLSDASDEEEGSVRLSRRHDDKLVRKYNVWEANHAYRALKTPTPRNRSVSVPTSSANDGYAADKELTPGADREDTPSMNPFLISPSETAFELLRERPGNGLIKSLEDSIRFCVFNTEHTTKREFWGIIKERLSPEILSGVHRVQNIVQPNGRKRMDMWVAARVASKLKSALYLTATARREGVTTNFKFPMRELGEVWMPNASTKHWRIDVYRKWRERVPTQVFRKEGPLPLPRKKVLTFNVNGINNKHTEVMALLEESEVGIAALQETLIDRNTARLRMPGYEVYERSKTKIFRGQALLIHKSYTSYEVGKDKHDSYIHVKVVGLTEGQPWHVFAVYLPSGGNYRQDRRLCLKAIMKECKNIRHKEPTARILMMGDFNMTRHRLQKRLTTAETNMEVLGVRGSGITFHRKSANRSDIDSFVVSKAALPALINARVKRQWGIDPEKDSDHYPLLTAIRKKTELFEVSPPPRFRFNVEQVRGHGSKIVFSNRWSCLPMDPITSPEELDQATISFTNAINMTGIEEGIKRQVGGKVFTHDRVTKRALKKAAQARNAWRIAVKGGSSAQATLLKRYEDLKKSTRKMIRRKEKQREAKEAARVAELYRDHEMKAFHRWETEATVKGGKTAYRVTPVMDKGGVLLTQKADILKRTNEYYKDLLQDDPQRLSRNSQHWKGKAQEKRKDALPCNDPITWRETLLAIRSMALGTSPGIDDIPIEVYKAMLKEECHQHLKTQGVNVGDATYIALPEHSLPTEPCTPMGKQLQRIIKGMWSTAAQPTCWSKVINISLYKSGDPTDLANYRGVSLVAVGMKVFTVTLALRISKLAELNHLFITEQGGFRDGEEAIAQFIALAEIARRRRLKNDKTWVVFIDFKKAFDKVMHEALFEKMEAAGFRGQFLEVIKAIYRTSTASTRVGGEYGLMYDMIRGTRQGCPLSPILFLLFINDFLKYVPEGVTIPGVEKPPTKCAGLLFADDVAGLVESTAQAHAFLEGVTKWSQDWHMPMGANKCGVMLIGGNEEEQEELQRENFKVDGQKVEVVRSYKYLGIVISDKLGDKEQTDEITHGRTLAQKVKQAVDMRRAFLRNKAYPIDLKVAVINSKILSVGCYGGEWIGYCQKRTNPIQTQLNVALRLVLGSASRSTMHAMKALSIELGVPTIEQRMAEMRTRLWQKTPELKTWLNHLADPENEMKGRTKAWCGTTAKLLHRSLPKLVRNTDILAQRMLERTMVDKRVKEMLSKAGRYSFLEDPLTQQDGSNPKRQREEQRVTVLARALYSDLYVAQIDGTTKYMSFGFDRTRNFIKSAVYVPALSEGTTWLVRLRTGGWWTTKRRYNIARHQEGGTDLLPDRCPCCEQAFGRDEEFVHILLVCPTWAEERQIYLHSLIRFFYSTQVNFEEVRVLDLSFSRLEIAVRLLGGCMLRSDYIPLYVKENREELWGNHNVGTPSPLDRFAAGWGGEGEIALPGLNAHGYVAVAKFLARVMPRHKAALFPLSKKNEGEGPMGRGGDDTSDGEVSPVKPRLAPGSNEFENISPLTYPQGRLSFATQADALRGMGTRSKHAHSASGRLDFTILPPEDTDEESAGEEGMCPDGCYARITVINDEARTGVLGGT